MEKIIDKKISICWLRRDLRLFDNAALKEAIKSPFRVLVIFIFDRNILDQLPDSKDKRLVFIHRQLEKINRELQEKGSELMVFNATPKKAFQQLFSEYDVQGIYTNRDYEPYAISRDREIAKMAEENSVEFHIFKDQVIFEKDEILKPDGDPYTVFTPYSKRWKENFFKESREEFDIALRSKGFFPLPKKKIPSLQEIGFEDLDFQIPPADISEEMLRNYKKTRDLPAVDGTSHLGIHLRFGTVSIRQVVEKALRFSETFLNELIWREFFMMILYHFPHVVDHNFRSKYDRLHWRNNEKEFELWCRGETGYPMVDAGMRQLNETGWMHNRVRMITAGFLTKHLLIDWRWGEAYFAEKLLDYELASNNGNWQWAAGTGCDAAPYFRIFNPETQLKKFDPRLEYVKTWIKDYKPGYLEPLVEHKFARERALEAYKKAVNS
ncbi:deoxyribodipyrimidine photo-lyase [Salinimicrobium catena]|uniref:Deoxyribodipyrimidine photo-lyase n=1 Tax=Salinimicrobium catena TaxID=390640 RepID=A0A1H5P428_9FLAO|nr:deoxyribodipyrimidine photo-lyase [Salinimicrobium catena]SDL69088.1 deoxyribodipyrimidine photo-lyase [Salinimicrobium catena]SEF07821.1 deoxyribodipyrimidine photo-lyase [Salinimicrobium catena]